MKKQLLTLFIFLFIQSFSNAQVHKNYKQSSKRQNANYYTIVNNTKEEFRNLDLASPAVRKAKKHFDRWSLYWKDRINPDGTFPSEILGYYNAGILDSDGKINFPDSNTAQRLTSQNWVNIGPEQSDINNNGYSNFPQMGRLNTLLRIKHPTDTNLDVLFVGAPNGGIWKSTDGGTNWTPKLDFVAGIGVTDIKTTPDATFANYTTKPIYVSTGDYDGDNVKSIGVLKSTDGGETFSSTGLSFTVDQEKTLGDLVVIDDMTVFVGENQFIKKTVDGGTNWANAYDAGFGNALFGRVAINGNEIMYTGAFDVYYNPDYTNDAGWSVVNSSNNLNKAAVTVDDAGDFYIQDVSGQIKKFNKMNSTFANFGNIPVGYESQGGFNQTLLVTGGLVINGDVNGHASNDNATNWIRSLNGYHDAESPGPPTGTFTGSDQGVYIHSDHHRMGKRDGTLEFWSVNDGGLSYFDFSSTSNLTPNVTYKSGRVKVLQSYSVAINPSANDGAIVAANQDNDGFSKRNGNWYAIALGDGIQGAINYNTPDIRYAGNQTGGIIKTTTGFVGELGGNGDGYSVPGANFFFPLEMSKVNPNLLFAGGDDVYLLDGSTGLSGSTTNSGLSGTVQTIATHGTNVLAADNTTIRFSSNNGGAWSSITKPAGVDNNITSVDFDATTTNTMYVTNSGYSSGNKVFKTTNGGTSWTNISGDLPNIVIKEVMLKQGQSQEYLFLATELGVYFTTNGGTNWAKLGQGLPNTDVRDLEIHYTADKLVIGTFGRGLWEINIQNSTLSDSNFNQNELDITAYPNPTKNIVNVSLTNEDFDYVMYNVVGGIVKSGKLTPNKKSIDVSNLAKNIYILRVYNSKSEKTFKIAVN